MIVSHQKEKAYNAIIYFLEHAGMCNKKKTYKLLFVLDFEHFQQTGRSITGYDYFAWKMGPVPTQLHEAIDSGDNDLLEYFDVVEQKGNKHGFDAISLRAKKPFDSKYFSKRELRLLRDVTDRFSMMTGNEMEDFTHRENTPWYRVWVAENRKQAKIPYEYSLDSLPEDKKQTVLEIAQEREEFLESYR